MRPKQLGLSLIVVLCAGAAMVAGVGHEPIIPDLASSATFSVSTVANGDQNPYGVAFVPRNFAGGGLLSPGDILVSNFNNATNAQGTGTTITRITSGGQPSVFFQGPSGLGLTTALGVLSAGFVIVGNVPTDASGIVQQGGLMILDASGNVVESLTDSSLLDGPWDLAIHDDGDQARVFVANVLSGTVTRIDLEIPLGGTPVVLAETQIASRYSHRTDPSALVVGPTGLAYDAKADVLYVASTGDNEIFSIPGAAQSSTDAGMGNLVYQDNLHLHGPLGLVLAPNGDLIASNGDAVNPDPSQLNQLVEFTAVGQFVSEFTLDPGGAGAAFGIAAARFGKQVRFAAVDDNANTLKVWLVQ
jgi:hypothetical protein